MPAGRQVQALWARGQARRSAQRTHRQKEGAPQLAHTMIRSCGFSSAVYTAKLAGEPEYGCVEGAPAGVSWRVVWPARQRGGVGGNGGVLSPSAHQAHLHVHSPLRRVQAEGLERAVAAQVLHLWRGAERRGKRRRRAFSPNSQHREAAQRLWERANTSAESRGGVPCR